MKILITNDDGIEAEGLKILASWAKKLGDVLIVAPKVNQSAKSMSINIRTAFEVLPYEYGNGIKAYSVDSTPCDCIRIAIDCLHYDCDIVFSGVNNGYNMGQDIPYSGTCGAIFEAVLHENVKNAIAFSANFDSFDEIEKNLDTAWSFIEKYNLLQKHNLYNVNMPNNVKGISFTKQGYFYFRDNFKEEEKNMFIAQGYDASKSQEDLTMDLEAVLFRNLISISPLTIERTERNVYETFKGVYNLEGEKL
ncbi:MAG: hypothetical protein HUK24_00160 [Sphaerochaetaceae bacterium]|nr:hypothetical protein [Sphaerochaetaceae bacterium]